MHQSINPLLLHSTTPFGPRKAALLRARFGGKRRHLSGAERRWGGVAAERDPLAAAPGEWGGGLRALPGESVLADEAGGHLPISTRVAGQPGRDGGVVAG